jgi:hypothetical protein
MVRPLADQGAATISPSAVFRKRMSPAAMRIPDRNDGGVVANEVEKL